jgi:hypothetical protein
MFGWRKKRRKAPAPEKAGVGVGSVMGARYKAPDQRAAEDAAVDEFNRSMSPGLRQPGPVRRSTPFSNKPRRKGTGL